ncbi:hypothetical protein MORE_11900 [Moorella thermoacetica]|nr:hypothetical protein MORE_11900 [Moorella thermoacetica]
MDDCSPFSCGHLTLTSETIFQAVRMKLLPPGILQKSELLLAVPYAKMKGKVGVDKPGYNVSTNVIFMVMV